MIENVIYKTSPVVSRNFGVGKKFSVVIFLLAVLCAYLPINEKSVVYIV